jgi:FkbM family methyltransferase
MLKQVVSVAIPVEILCDPGTGVAEEVLCGTYEAGFYGHHLTVLDIGANIGAFAIWANLRWPHSQILCYEPHPETFQTLVQNVAALDDVKCVNAAVYPRKMPLCARHANDGEAALLEHARRFFQPSATGTVMEVPFVVPRELPHADIVKVDTEGSEVEILKNLDLTETSLVLLEYHTLADRDEICRLLPEFSVAHEQRSPWAGELLANEQYRPELAGDFYGVLALHRPGSQRVWRNRIPAPPPPGLRQLVHALPGAVKASLLARIRR